MSRFQPISVGFIMVSCSSTHIIIIIIVINYTYCCYMALTCYHCYFLFIKVYYFYCCHFSRIILVYDHISWCIILTLRLFHFSQPSFCCWSKALCLLWSAVFGTSTDGKALESAVGGGGWNHAFNRRVSLRRNITESLNFDEFWIFLERRHIVLCDCRSFFCIQ